MTTDDKSYSTMIVAVTKLLSGILPSELTQLIVEEEVRNILRQNDLRAPERDGSSQNNIIPGLSDGNKSNHLNVTGLSTFVGDWILDNFLGDHRNDSIPVSTGAASPLQRDDEEIAIAFAHGPKEEQARSPVAFANFSEGTFEELGGFVAEVEQADPIPTGLEIVDLWSEIISDPQFMFSSVWNATGEARLVRDDTNWVVELTQTTNTSIGQLVVFDEVPEEVSFDLTVLAAGVDDHLEVVFDDFVLASLDLMDIAPEDRHYVSMVGIPLSSGNLTFRIVSPLDSPATVQLDNITTFTAPHADADQDGDVDGFGLLAWQHGFGILAPNALPGDGDADGDQDVDEADLLVWQTSFGVGVGGGTEVFIYASQSLGDLSSTDSELGDLDDSAIDSVVTNFADQPNTVGINQLADDAEVGAIQGLRAAGPSGSLVLGSYVEQSGPSLPTLTVEPPPSIGSARILYSLLAESGVDSVDRDGTDAVIPATQAAEATKAIDRMISDFALHLAMNSADAKSQYTPSHFAVSAPNTCVTDLSWHNGRRLLMRCDTDGQSTLSTYEDKKGRRAKWPFLRCGGVPNCGCWRCGVATSGLASDFGRIYDLQSYTPNAVRQRGIYRLVSFFVFGFILVTL